MAASSSDCNNFALQLPTLPHNVAEVATILWALLTSLQSDGGGGSYVSIPQLLDLSLPYFGASASNEHTSVYRQLCSSILRKLVDRHVCQRFCGSGCHLQYVKAERMRSRSTVQHGSRRGRTAAARVTVTMENSGEAGVSEWSCVKALLVTQLSQLSVGVRSSMLTFEKVWIPDPKRSQRRAVERASKRHRGE